MVKTFAGLTKAQHAVFEQIAAGNDAGHNPHTLATLRQHGMITVLGRPKRYFVPVAWRTRWCEWLRSAAGQEG